MRPPQLASMARTIPFDALPSAFDDFITGRIKGRVVVASDAALLALTFLGAVASILLVLNFAPRICIVVAGLCFLSFIGAAQDFASYQSDGMLLEAAFISFFLAPRGLRPGLAPRDPPSRFP